MLLATDNIADTVKAIDHFGDEITKALSKSIITYGPELHKAAVSAFDILVQVKQASCVATVISALFWTILYIVVAVAGFKISVYFQKLYDKYDTELDEKYKSIQNYNPRTADERSNLTAYAMGAFMGGAVVVIFIIVSLISIWPLSDPWNWIGIFNPKVAVFHDVIQKVLSQ